MREAYADLEVAILAAESGVSAVDLQARLNVVVKPVYTAAEEYELSIRDGVIVNVHEYQDAMGFVRIAGKIIDSMDTGSDMVSQKVLEKVRMQIQVIEFAWEGGVVPEKAGLHASLFYVAANRIAAAASAAGAVQC